MLDHSLYPR
jgi:2,5-furandicarboxylate decarboxylase 1